MLTRQFAEPSGWLGAWIGRFMARMNAPLTGEAIDRIKLAGDEHALEVGFGPGVGVAILAARLPFGKVCGIDLSEVMRRQAHARLRAYTDRVELQVGSVRSLPWPDSSFDVVCATNSAQFWEPLDESVREIHRVLKDGGHLSIVLHATGIAVANRERGIEPARNPEPVITELERALQSAGLTQVQTKRKQVKGGVAFFLSALARGT